MNNVYPQLTIDFSFPSELGFEKLAREVIAAFACRAGFDTERVEDLKTALGEACINAIEHGNRRVPGLRIDIRCACDEQCLVIHVSDQGVQRYGGSGAPATIASKLLGQAPFRGMGLMMIQQLVDEAAFVEDAQGNCFRLAMYRTRAPHEVHNASAQAWLPA